jgi:glycosyltransferase involved in cell wall biosynthesis
MNKPTVSVVMAAKNYARFIREAIDSVFAQTVEHWELIVIDDGSSDDTEAAVRPYLVDHRVRYVRSDHLGQSRAKNLGLGLSSGEFVAFLDADDAWLPTKLERQLAVFHANPAVGVCFSGRRIIDETGREHPPAPSPRWSEVGDVLAAVFRKNFVCFSSVLARRAVFDHVGGFDTGLDLAIDYDLWLRVAAHHPFDFVPDPLVLYRTGHGNLSKKLSDRVATAVSVITRAVDRRGLQDRLTRDDVGVGYSSTCGALAYVLRESEPLAAARWYWRAARWSGRPLSAARGLLACAARWANQVLTGRRVAASPENAAANR